MFKIIGKKKYEMLEKRIKETEEAIRFLLRNGSIKPSIEIKFEYYCPCGVVTYVYDGEVKKSEFRAFGMVDTEVVEDHHNCSVIAVKNGEKIRYLMLDKCSGQIVNVDKIYTTKDERNGTN